MDERPRYDAKLARILQVAAGVFAEKGYHRASIRDIAAATEVSLSGLYYYFESKEALLFLIQRHCFGTILERAQAELDGVDDAEERLRIVVRTHLRFFLNNMREMKVLSHEAEVLTGRYQDEVSALKRKYAAIVSDILRDLRGERDGPDLRIATFTLFGMMNWIYTWYKPGKDPGAEALASEVLHIFLNGFRSGAATEADEAEAEHGDGAPSIWRG